MQRKYPLRVMCNIYRGIAVKPNYHTIPASCEDWTHDPWLSDGQHTRPVLYHWAKEAADYM